MFSKKCKNTWVKDLKIQRKNSKMYKIKHIHIIISKPSKSDLMIITHTFNLLPAYSPWLLIITTVLAVVVFVVLKLK